MSFILTSGQDRSHQKMGFGFALTHLFFVRATSRCGR